MPAPTSGRPHAYCTYFDSGYLSRGLALIESLREHGDDAPVWVLALDDAAKRYLDDAALPGVTAITIADIEAAEPALPPLKSERSRMEYYFTATPLLMRWVIGKQHDPQSVVIYLDADLFFFDRPGLVLDALGDGAVGIIEHRYPPSREKALLKYGRFNVGWVGIRADERGRACVDWWSASTLAWCFDKPEGGKYADQGYLDSFPRLFDGVVILPSLGMNLAPWNTAGVALSETGGTVVVEERDPLVFFHFHGLRRVRGWYVSSQLIYRAPMSRVLCERVYAPYVRRLATADAMVAGALGPPAATKARGNGLRGVLSRARKAAVDALSIASRNAVKVDELAGGPVSRP
ncbi:MAG: hypothetical protein ABIQ01_10895 [Pseudolysinimonas sp.]